MVDSSTDPGPAPEGQGIEINANVDGLLIDGTAPEVGDHVETKVGGTVSKVVNGVASISVETVNGTPMPAAPAVAEASEPNESADLGAMAAAADANRTY